LISNKRNSKPVDFEYRCHYIKLYQNILVSCLVLSKSSRT